MCRLFIALVSLCVCLTSFAADAGKVVKVLPFLVDAQGQIAKSPSLFDRDAYQAYLRDHTNDISGIRYDVLWRADKSTTQPLKLQLELRCVDEKSLPQTKTLEAGIPPGTFSHWTEIKLTGDDYKKCGSIVAWRTTLWSGTNVVGEQKSFLW